ncbi:Inner membrane protein YecN [Labrenzia sp. THAF82]|uniref:MAPEG family protein n=1 Tax=Labrenzia sp. THAF82 TaxID=2587861 RepID=UPI001267D2AD|nr:MAPEG family protein [Labrenzia sp. THAF82]QFT33836.1 Inner membrane protein YecN [Labrenzia sp. THAF82]
MNIVSTFPVTLLFIALLALVQIPMTVAVGLRRLKTETHFLDGGDELLLKRMRAHGNFTETVPIVLLAMAAAEYCGAPTSLLWAGGCSLLLGRLVHYGTLVNSGFGNGRAVGMLLTLAPMLIFPGFVLWALAGVSA